MPTILTHSIIPISARLGFGKPMVGKSLLLLGMVYSMLPDIDVLGFRFGVPYASQWGHRGFTHSLFFAAVLAGLASFMAARLSASRAMVFGFLFLSMGSHGLLDSLTNGGLGIALLWPFNDERYFAPNQPIEVSPIGLSNFLSHRGLEVLGSELLWVWLPFLTLALALWMYRHLVGKRMAQKRPSESL